VIDLWSGAPAAGPTTSVPGEQDRFAGGAGEQAGAAPEIDHPTDRINDDSADRADQGGEE
jgi:hypothetical protein